MSEHPAFTMAGLCSVGGLIGFASKYAQDDPTLVAWPCSLANCVLALGLQKRGRSLRSWRAWAWVRCTHSLPPASRTAATTATRSPQAQARCSSAARLRASERDPSPWASPSPLPSLSPTMVKRCVFQTSLVPPYAHQNLQSSPRPRLLLHSKTGVRLPTVVYAPSQSSQPVFFFT